MIITGDILRSSHIFWQLYNLNFENFLAYQDLAPSNTVCAILNNCSIFDQNFETYENYLVFLHVLLIIESNVCVYIISSLSYSVPGIF